MNEDKNAEGVHLMQIYETPENERVDMSTEEVEAALFTEEGIFNYRIQITKNKYYKVETFFEHQWITAQTDVHEDCIYANRPVALRFCFRLFRKQRRFVDTSDMYAPTNSSSLQRKRAIRRNEEKRKESRELVHANVLKLKD